MASFADVYASEPQIAAEVEQFRFSSDRIYGRSILTEHGRIPVCVDEDKEPHDAHCYHAHALLFPTELNLPIDMRSYFLDYWRFSSLKDALTAASTEGAYFLFSERADVYELYSGPLNLPRQFARMMVAYSIGSKSADWRSNPQVDEAERNAATLRSAWGDLT